MIVENKTSKQIIQNQNTL